MFRIKQTITSELPPDEILALFHKHFKGPICSSFMVASAENETTNDARTCLQIEPLQLNALLPVYTCNIMTTGNTTTILVQPSHFRKVFALFAIGAVIFLYLLLTTETGSSRSLPAGLLLTIAGFSSASILALLVYRYCTGKITSILHQMLHTEDLIT